jgi:nicotinate-nucleotide adenylyltransferase
LILGQDQYGRIDTWRNAAQWRPLVCFAVAARDGRPPEPPVAWAGQPVDHVVLPLPPMAVSASDIRARIAAGQPVSPLVGEDVARYIEQHRLYRASPGH